ncbi:hypothetical protein DYU05_04775 [Mucilaginibacter terrenus]|uniref:Uncharacterized protein n=1 Tax=Mucilaginibacter terrenus TaxID=2482727 RepID=A0A3E2NV78_9SPHI|nr:tetratricopeptide repeat protein [Mucilaginibacter terrenus]RFZ84923.1 hypothetical protein DYU05_04775 [Mucilaginibacter terrenus]
MKRYLTLLFCLMCFVSYAQKINYINWKTEASNDIRLQPEYGHAVKTKEQIAADDELIATVLKQDRTRRKGSDHLINLEFKYLYNSDMRTAMSRFNQAYLLDPKNENVYWGYGAVYVMFGDKEEAIRQYDKGLSINPNSAVILTDKATIYFAEFQQEQGKFPEKLEKALTLLNASYKVDPKNLNTLYKLSICYFLIQDCANAWKYYKDCQALGGTPISPDFTTALKRQCK